MCQMTSCLFFRRAFVLLGWKFWVLLFAIFLVKSVSKHIGKEQYKYKKLINDDSINKTEK